LACFLAQAQENLASGMEEVPYQGDYQGIIWHGRQQPAGRLAVADDHRPA